MTFCEKVKAKKFVITSEIEPPKGIDAKEILDRAELIRSRVDAINVTDQQSSVMKAGSLALCSLLKARGIEPIFQLTCRDRNRIALQSDLLSAGMLGIENVLILTGDYPTLGDHPQAKPVFDLGSVQLLKAARSLQEGHDMNGAPLKGSPRFCLGAVVNPGADPIEPEIIKMEQKIDAGAQFFQTQAVYDIDLFKRFLDRIGHIDIPIIAGIVILKSRQMAHYMNENVAGVVVPATIIKEISESKDRVSTAVDIASRLIRGLKPVCQGIHLIPIGWDAKLAMILDAAGL